MTTQVKFSRIAISKILLATDFSPESQNALKCAISLAKRYESKLFLAHAISEETFLTGAEVWPALIDTAQRNAEKNMARIEQDQDLQSLAHEVLLQAGETWEVLSRLVSDQNIDLIVMGTHGSGGIDKLMLGSTAEKVVRHAPCPVLTVGPRVRLLSLESFSNILYATDFSSGSLRALNYALSLAEEDRAELTMLHVIESLPVSDGEFVEWKRRDCERLRQLVPTGIDLPSQPEMEVEVGDPAEEIVRLADARNAELIVMGSHPSGAVSTHLPWTTLHHVLQHAHCPVLTVRAT
ncbi:MAG: universal stress protein [Candidatus Korobacteraceae bacterium]